jgi:energy-coupling factor transport system ATP-binding protein
MGQNGAGKTTLIRLFNGLIRPIDGNILIHGEKINSKSIASLSRNIGIIFQNPMHQLFANTLEEEIKFSLKNLELTKEEIQKKTDEIITEYNFENYRNRSPLNLSGGESKKLAVASIICRNPEILVFDEPTLGQDATEINFFIETIQKELKKGKTIIMVTHNIEFAVEYIPRIILMSKGQIIGDGPAEEILINEALLNKSSLIPPQLYQLKNELQKLDIEIPISTLKEKEFSSLLLKKIKNGAW